MPLVLPRDGAWALQNPCSLPWGHLFCWKPHIKVQFGICGDRWQTANGPIHTCRIPWDVLGSLPSRGGLEAKPGEKDLWGESGATGTQEIGEKVREGRAFPSPVCPLILHQFCFTPGYCPTALHNQFMPAGELRGFHFWSHQRQWQHPGRKISLPAARWMYRLMQASMGSSQTRAWSGGSAKGSQQLGRCQSRGREGGRFGELQPQKYQQKMLEINWGDQGNVQTDTENEPFPWNSDYCSELMVYLLPILYSQGSAALLGLILFIPTEEIFLGGRRLAWERLFSGVQAQLL